MNRKLEELRSQIAQMELGYRECSAKFLYVKDEMEEKDTKIKQLKDILQDFADRMKIEGILWPEDEEKLKEVGIVAQDI